MCKCAIGSVFSTSPITFIAFSSTHISNSEILQPAALRLQNISAYITQLTWRRDMEIFHLFPNKMKYYSHSALIRRTHLILDKLYFLSKRWTPIMACKMKKCPKGYNCNWIFTQIIALQQKGMWCSCEKNTPAFSFAIYIYFIYFYSMHSP